MSDNKVYKMCVTALLTALTCVATMVIHVPTPVTNGYVNVGDVVVLLSGWLLLGQAMSSREIFDCTLVFAAIMLAQIPTEMLPWSKKQAA